MPLVRIDLLEGKTPEYRSQIGQIVYQSLLDCFSVPKDDRFQVIAEHPKAELRRCLHQSGGSAERKLVIRQWRSPVRRRDNYIVRYDERDGTPGAMNTGKYPYQGTASEMSPKTTALNGFSRPDAPRDRG